VEQATSVLRNETVPPEQLLPNTNVWMEELLIVLRDAPNRRAPLSLTSSLGGAYYLVTGHDTSDSAHALSRDRRGRCIPARMALYTTKLISSGFDLSSIPQKLRTELLYLLSLVVAVAQDEVLTTAEGLAAGSRLWHPYDNRTHSGGVQPMLQDFDVALADMDDFISSGRRVMADIITSTTNQGAGQIVGGSLVGDLISIMLDQAKGLTSLAFYSAKALADILESLTEAHGLPPTTEDTLAKLEILKAKPETAFSAIAFLIGFGETLVSSKAVKLFCNRLISDVAGAAPTGANTVLTLVLLNAALSVYGCGELPVESRRQVFAIRQITSWLEKGSDLDPSLAAEACKALNRLFPNIGTVYGPYWEQAIEFCIALWNGVDSRAWARLCTEPCLHASLKLYATLESLKGGNDDLDDALAAHAEAASRALLHLLRGRVGPSNTTSDIVDALLCRQVAKIPLEHVKDLSDLYGLVASESRDIQTAAFGILSKAIAAAQAQISVNVLLEKRGKNACSKRTSARH
jgi:hypothetical protein